MTWSRGNAVLSAICAVFLGSVAFAQQPQLNDGPVTETKKNVEFTLYGGGQHLFETNIDAGGDMEVTRAGFGINANSEITRDLDLNIGFEFLWSDYNFSGDTALGGPDPWDDVQTYTLSALMNWNMSSDWTMFGGPIFRISRESGADFSDSFTGGGIIGVSYKVGPDLTLGGGLGAMSQLEDSMRLFPVFAIEWQITNELRLTSRLPAQVSRTIGMELVWDLDGGWEAAIGGGYEFHRFRLDDDGLAPDGAGQDESIPLWTRLSYATEDNLTFNFYAGISATGTLNLDSDIGIPITEEDYDSAIIIGASASIQF